LNISNKIFAKNGAQRKFLRNRNGIKRETGSCRMLRLIRAQQSFLIQSILRPFENGFSRLIFIGIAIIFFYFFLPIFSRHDRKMLNSSSAADLPEETSMTKNTEVSYPNFLKRDYPPDLPDFPSCTPLQFKDEIGSLDAEFFSSEFIKYEAFRDEEV
jgi:hypothetical protein